jgi:flagellin
MGIVVNTNVSSDMIQRSLSLANKEVEQSMIKIAYGRVSQAVEDAAGLSISETLKAQARGSEVAYNNAQTGINLLQTAESDLSSINDNLQRVRELTVQSANGTYGESEREAINAEIESLVSEIDRVSESSSFADVKLLNGESDDIALQIGANSDAETNALQIGEVLKSASVESLGIPKGDDLNTALSSSDNVRDFLNKIDDAISTVNSRRADTGSMQNRLESTVNSLEITQQNMIAAESRIRDVDIAKEMSTLTQNKILQEASSMLLAQANQNPGIAISLL